MYNVPPHTPHSAIYESNQHYQNARQPSAMQLLSGVAASTGYYAGAAEQSTTPSQPASAPGIYQQQQSPADRAALLTQAYPANLHMGPIPAVTPSALDTQDHHASPDVDAPNEIQPSRTDIAYAAFETTLRGIFRDIVDGNLIPASRSLLDISDWLLRSVTEVGS